MRGDILRVFEELGVPKCRFRADLQDPGPFLFLSRPGPNNIEKIWPDLIFSRFTNKKLVGLFDQI